MSIFNRIFDARLAKYGGLPLEAQKDGPHSSVVEHFLGKEEVTGSIPVVGSIRFFERVIINFLVE